MQYHRLVPHDSFMGRYLSYMQSQETAHAFDFWSGMFCVSTACARNTWVDRPRAPVFLNMFTILVGESGRPRKSASISHAQSIIRHLIDENEDLAHIDAKVTPEKLNLILHDRTMEYGNAQLCITVPELAVFLGTERYISAMPILLTDLYDCPAARDGGGTIQRGKVLQRNVWVSFLSASTPIWLLKTVNPNVIEGGFTSRCFFIVSNEPKRAIPWPMDTDPQLQKAMIDDIKRIQKHAAMRDPIQLTESAMVTYTTWYAHRERSYDPFKQSFQAREDAHVLRVAALLSINDGTWLIRRSHISVAIRLVHQVKERSNNIFEGAEVQSKFALGFDHMRSMLVSTGLDPLRKSEIYTRIRGTLTHDEFMTLIEIMHEIGAIQRFSVPSETRGRPTEYIRGTNLILTRGLGEKVLERF